MHWVPTGQTVNKEYYVEVLREFRKRFRRKRPALFKSGQWHFHQDNSPVNKSILVTDYFTKMGIKTVRHPPHSPDLAPCDFWLFPKLIGLYTPINYFGRYATCSHNKDGGRTYSVSGNHWPGEPRDMLKTTSARKFSSCVRSHLQDAYFL